MVVRCWKFQCWWPCSIPHFLFFCSVVTSWWSVRSIVISTVDGIDWRLWLSTLARSGVTCQRMWTKWITLELYLLSRLSLSCTDGIALICAVLMKNGDCFFFDILYWCEAATSFVDMMALKRTGDWFFQHITVTIKEDFVFRLQFALQFYCVTGVVKLTAHLMRWRGSWTTSYRSYVRRSSLRQIPYESTTPLFICWIMKLLRLRFRLNCPWST